MQTIAVLACHGVAAFELAVPCEVWGIDRTAQGVPAFRFVVAAGEPPPVRTSVGFTIDTPHGLEALAAADIVVVPPAGGPDRPPPAPAVEALWAAHRRGARLLSVCSGAFVLAQAGLLDGRRATTHWMYTDELARRFPAVEVDPRVLYVDDGDILTSAGTAAGIDLCLHVVRRDHGAEVANTIARRMVVPPHRDGGQAQFVEAPMPSATPDDPLAATLGWMLEHLDEPLSVEELAARSMLSPRHFARRFRAVTGTTPHQWLLSQRVLLASRLLETTDEPVEGIARRCGMGTAANLRTHFARVVGTSPTSYRRTFRRAAV
jgi:transcriptional regulator GlxA family with amidase domain